MSRFTLPRDIYHGPGSLSEIAKLKGKKAFVVTGGGSMKRFGFLGKTLEFLREAGMETHVFEGVEPDPSVETVRRGAEEMKIFCPDWIVAIGGGSPIDAAKAMWAFMSIPTFHLNRSALRSAFRSFGKRLISVRSRQRREVRPRSLHFP